MPITCRHCNQPTDMYRLIEGEIVCPECYPKVTRRIKREKNEYAENQAAKKALALTLDIRD